MQERLDNEVGRSCGLVKQRSECRRELINEVVEEKWYLVFLEVEHNNIAKVKSFKSARPWSVCFFHAYQPSGSIADQKSSYNIINDTVL